MNKETTNRRGFLRQGAKFGLAAAIAATGVKQAVAQIPTSELDLVTPGDIAILQFLAGAEALENDLWQQYTELSQGNFAYQAALQKIDPALIAYINQDRRDELSHFNLINAVLGEISATLPLNVEQFMVVPPPNVTGIAQSPRITNLQNLNVDTSWFNRYRATDNPDYPPAPESTAQFITISGQPTIPVSNSAKSSEIQLAAHCAAFHFGAIEQGGASLYNGLLDAMISPLARAIVASIGPTELYHFVAFHKSLENLPALNVNGLSFPDLKLDPALAQAIMPTPCTFLESDLPLCSIIRPRSDTNAGPLAAASGLAASGLFAGNPGFVSAAVALATAAETAVANQTAQLLAFAKSL